MKTYELETQNSHRGVCNLCNWRSVMVPIDVAKSLATVHVIFAHPQKFKEVTGEEELPELSETTLIFLIAWTEHKGD